MTTDYIKGILTAVEWHRREMNSLRSDNKHRAEVEFHNYCIVALMTLLKEERKSEMGNGIDVT